MLEHSFFTVYYSRTSPEEMARQIRDAGCENVFLTSDFGQPKSPYFDEGMEQFFTLLLEHGFTETEVLPFGQIVTYIP